MIFYSLKLFYNLLKLRTTLKVNLQKLGKLNVFTNIYKINQQRITILNLAETASSFVLYSRRYRNHYFLFTQFHTLLQVSKRFQSNMSNNLSIVNRLTYWVHFINSYVLPTAELPLAVDKFGDVLIYILSHQICSHYFRFCNSFINQLRKCNLANLIGRN